MLSAGSIRTLIKSPRKEYLFIADQSVLNSLQEPHCQLQLWRI
jgi:hypothetical protein